MKYYNVDEIVKQDTVYNFILGGRANGKSTGVLKYFIDDYFKSNKKNQFGLIRRYKIDNFYLQNYISQYLMTYCIENYDCIIEYQASKFWVKTVDGTKTIGILGYVFCLSDINNIKSTQYDYVTSVLFDEFIPMTYGEMLNGNNEPTLLIHVLSTVFRHRNNCKVFLVANTITKDNCYFDYFKIDLNLLDTSIGVHRITEYVSIEFVQSAYESDEEVPLYLKCIDDKAFTTGEFSTPYNIISSNMIDNSKVDTIGYVIAKERKYYVNIVSTYDDYYYYFSIDILSIKSVKNEYVITMNDITEYILTNKTTFDIDEMFKAIEQTRILSNLNMLNIETFKYKYTRYSDKRYKELSVSKLSKDKNYIFNVLDIKKECYYQDGIILSVIENIKMIKKY